AAAVARGLSLMFGAYALLVSIVGLAIQAANPGRLILHPAQLEPIYAASVGHGVAAVVFLALSVIVRRRGARPGLPRTLLILAPILFLLSVDRIVNVVHPPPPKISRTGIFIPHSRRWMTHAPLSQGRQDNVMAYIDRYGMRVTKPQWKRTLGDAPRILFLGDSITFGYDVPAEDGFVERIQAMLDRREDAPAFIAMNAGTISATPRQELDWLTHEGVDVGSDLVVLQICMNDITYMLHPSVLASGDHGVIAETNEHVYWSGLMRVAHDWARRRKYGDDLDQAAQMIATENFDKLLDKSKAATTWEAWGRATGDWEAMVRFCRTRKIPIAFMIVPLRKQIQDRSVSIEPQKRIQAFARQWDVPCLDLTPLLRSLHLDRGEPISELYSDYTHPSAPGHRVVAEALYSFLEANGLFDKARAHWVASGEDIPG
ncbi:MAG: hypothetical protein KDA33_02960, partial [Phycisphaerales bacterium]|nr:hypothetical protein [Phycisphaerales bacterium]